jgi:hypothetical protein
MFEHDGHNDLEISLCLQSFLFFTRKQYLTIALYFAYHFIHSIQYIRNVSRHPFIRRGLDNPVRSPLFMYSYINLTLNPYPALNQSTSCTRLFFYIIFRMFRRPYKINIKSL